MSNSLTLLSTLTPHPFFLPPFPPHFTGSWAVLNTATTSFDLGTISFLSSFLSHLPSRPSKACVVSSSSLVCANYLMGCFGAFLEYERDEGFIAYCAAGAAGWAWYGVWVARRDGVG